MARTAVFLSVFYTDQLEEILEQLKNLDKAEIEWDLYATICDAAQGVLSVAEAKALIERKFDGAKVWEVPNVGYDVAPFVDFLHKVAFSSYDYVLKLHTKRRLKAGYGKFNGRRFDVALWRDILIEELVGNVCNVRRNFEILEKRAEVGMVAAKFFVTDEKRLFSAFEEELEQERKRLGFDLFSDRHFVAGTMFLARINLFKPFCCYDLGDFGKVDVVVHDRTMAHLLERLLGLCVGASGYKIEGVIGKRYLLRRMSAVGRRFLWQKKVSQNGVMTLKVLTVPVWRKKC